MHEVRGAIQRVDDPRDLAGAAGAAFLGKEGVVRIRIAQRLDDGGLGRKIDAGDEVVQPLGGGFHALETSQAAHDDFTGATGSLHGSIQIGMHDGHRNRGALE